MTTAYARAKRGERAVDYTPFGHWHTTTLVAAITSEGPIAPMLLDGPMDRVAFEAYVEQFLAKAVPANATVIMDNLSAHKSAAVAEALKKHGATLRFLPPYSPDFNPIEPMWSKVKNSLRRQEPRDAESLSTAIANALEEITASDAAGFFQHCFVCMQS